MKAIFVLFAMAFALVAAEGSEDGPEGQDFNGEFF